MTKCKRCHQIGKKMKILTILRSSRYGFKPGCYKYFAFVLNYLLPAVSELESKIKLFMKMYLKFEKPLWLIIDFIKFSTLIKQF